MGKTRLLKKIILTLPNSTSWEPWLLDFLPDYCMYWSQKDAAYVTEAPELAGCITDRETYQEALTNVEVVMDEWIETAQMTDQFLYLKES